MLDAHGCFQSQVKRGNGFARRGIHGRKARDYRHTLDTAFHKGLGKGVHGGGWGGMHSRLPTATKETAPDTAVVQPGRLVLSLSVPCEGHNGHHPTHQDS